MYVGSGGDRWLYGVFHHFHFPLSHPFLPKNQETLSPSFQIKKPQTKMDDEKRSRLICELSDSDRLGTPSPTSTFSSSSIPSPKSSSPPIPSLKSSSPPLSSSSSSSDGVTSSYQPQPSSSSALPRSLKRKLIDEDDLEGSLLSFVQSLKDNVIRYFSSRTAKGINCSDLDVLQQRWILLASSLAQTGGDRTVVRKSFSELCNLVWDGLAEKKNDRDMYLGGLKPLLGKLNQLQLTFPDDCQQCFSQMMKRCNLRCAGGEDFAFIKLLVVVRVDPGLPGIPRFHIWNSSYMPLWALSVMLFI